MRRFRFPKIILTSRMHRGAIRYSILAVPRCYATHSRAPQLHQQLGADPAAGRFATETDSCRLHSSQRAISSDASGFDVLPPRDLASLLRDTLPRVAAATARPSLNCSCRWGFSTRTRTIDHECVLPQWNSRARAGGGAGVAAAAGMSRSAATNDHLNLTGAQQKEIWQGVSPQASKRPRRPPSSHR